MRIWPTPRRPRPCISRDKGLSLRSAARVGRRSRPARTGSCQQLRNMPSQRTRICCRLSKSASPTSTPPVTHTEQFPDMAMRGASGFPPKREINTASLACFGAGDHESKVEIVWIAHQGQHPPRLGVLHGCEIFLGQPSVMLMALINATQCPMHVGRAEEIPWPGSQFPELI